MTGAEGSTRDDAPLAGLRVLDLSRLYPGAMCGLLLADMGADVLKAEAPGTGDMMRFVSPGPYKSAHTAYNRGKRSMQLDLKHERAGEVLSRLIPTMDVVIESHRPGALDAAGMGYEQLSKVNPRLIWCSLTGFGPDGPNAQAPGHDITYLAASGLLSVISGGERPPLPDVVITIPLAALMGALGIVAAVHRRERTGRGGRVDPSMTDSAMWLLSEEVSKAATAPQGAGWGALASRAMYQCADGRWVAVANSEPKPWALTCEALGLPDLVGYQHGTDEAGTMARLAEAFATKPAAHWAENPGLAGGVALVKTPDDLVDDPQVTARNGLVPLEGTDAKVLASPLRFDGRDAAASSYALSVPPELGQHTDEALAEAGFSPEEIASLRADGVV